MSTFGTCPTEALVLYYGVNVCMLGRRRNMDNRWRVDGRPVQFRCPFCGSWVDVLTTKRGKPYALCMTCGVQIFWRLPPGIERLARAARHPDVSDVRFVETDNGR